MVSSCELYLDDIDLIGQKAYVPDYLSSLFQESDRVESYDNETGENIVSYRETRDSILRRLDFMGCTEKLSRQRFEEWRDNEIKEEEAGLDDIDYGKDAFSDDGTLAALRKLSWDEWRRRVPGVLRSQYDQDNYDKFVDETDRRMKDSDPSWLWFDGYDSLLSLRAIINACEGVLFINLDIGSLISGGWIGEDEKICTNKIRVVTSRGHPSGPTIILAEGESDIAILKASISKFYPELSDFITFLDHREFRVDGGASYVVKFLKAFAAARVPANIVAVFDNDTAGLMSYKEAVSLSLPSNITSIHLPDIDLGCSYPTIGPQGMHETNINGKACGIELYLGKEALSINGSLRPVRWTGYDKRAGCYQGEIQEKSDVQDNFMKSMRYGDVDVDENYPEMKLLWETIINAAVQVAEASQTNARIPRIW